MIDSNYHTHTMRCKHAVGQEREYIEYAIKNGFKTLGFSDHVPQPFPDGYVSPIRMDMSQLDEYVDTLLALKHEYAGRINILIGFEVEYYPAYFDKLLKELRRRPETDYIILGQHNVDDELTGAYSGSRTDDPVTLRRYVDNCIDGLKTGLFTYLAHPDLIYFTGDRGLFLNEMSRICEYTKAHDIPLELNIQGFELERNYPGEEFFRLAGQYGCRIILGIDAHRPDRVRQPEEVKGLSEFITRCNLKCSQKLDLKSIH
ncbi:MAG: histidinol-phosphatase [Lachnospiraceae bacterium]|nr:histidinol-phosphatase [Lachnospiraceae bacterium]